MTFTSLLSEMLPFCDIAFISRGLKTVKSPDNFNKNHQIPCRINCAHFDPWGKKLPMDKNTHNRKVQNIFHKLKTMNDVKKGMNKWKRWQLCEKKCNSNMLPIRHLKKTTLSGFYLQGTKGKKTGNQWMWCVCLQSAVINLGKWEKQRNDHIGNEH